MLYPASPKALKAFENIFIDSFNEEIDLLLSMIDSKASGSTIGERFEKVILAYLKSVGGSVPVYFGTN